MMELMVVHPHIFWLSLGGLLLAAEMLGGNGYLLWSGVAAVITGLVVWLLPLGWEWQGVMFAVLTLLAAWLCESGQEEAFSQLLAWHLLPWSGRFLAVFIAGAGHPFYQSLAELAQATLAEWQHQLPIAVADKPLYR